MFKAPIASALALLLLATAFAQPVQAQAQGAPEAPVSSQPLLIRRAETHFKRGVELYSEGNSEAAMVEFRRAYDLAPRYPILYNMGQVAYSLNDYAAAVDLFEHYLATGKTNIAVDRRKAVRTEIERLRDRIGRIHIVADTKLAGVVIDDVPLSKPTLAPVVVNIGRRKVSVFTADRRSATKVVEVAAGETVRVAFHLLAPAHVSRRASTSVSRDAAPEQKRSMRARNIVAWAFAGSLVAGAAVTGVLAWQESRELGRSKESYPLESAEQLQAHEGRVSRLALLTDGLLVGAAIAATVAAWLTFSEDGGEELEASSTRRPRRLSLHPAIGPTGVAVLGTF